VKPVPGAEPEVFERGQPRDPERVVLGQLTVDVPLPGHHHGEVDQGAAARPPVGIVRSRRPARFVARRTAWYALDHAWEMEDKREPRGEALV
jgi:hypothetical protein